jgi:DNA-directed RNA polymerase subunit beta'
MADTQGRTVEIPIRANFREGLNVLEYFISSHGARKGLTDTALRTADSGYLTRRLVDVSQDVIIREENCGTAEGIWVRDIIDGTDIIEKFEDRIFGRYTIDPVVHPATGEVLVEGDTLLLQPEVDKILKAGITELYVRSILKCKCRYGVCSHCYGNDLATGKKVNVGEAVGIVAAQSIGEPGTQLTMRTFHSGGIAGSDITQGLPRVEELFEARKPKKTAVVSEISGRVSIVDDKRTHNVIVTDLDGEAVSYKIPYVTRIIVNEGDFVARGDALTEGNMSPEDITRIRGLDAVYEYITREIQRVYRLQSVNINDKHVEVIARQMTRKIRVDDIGDTDLLVGSLVDVTEFEIENEKIQKRIDAGELTLRLATGTPKLLGITKAALNTTSFLSAASFQETTKVLTDAAINGKVDNLLGLKENVIIGKLIPAGTGMERYRNIEVVPVEIPEASDEEAEAGNASETVIVAAEETEEAIS